jgi:hypothetical protein
MALTAAHISPLIALVAGILILIVPQLLKLHRRNLSYRGGAHRTERHLSFRHIRSEVGMNKPR